MLSLLGNISADDSLKYFFLVFPENKLTFHINGLLDNLHEMSKPIFCKNKKYCINL